MLETNKNAVTVMYSGGDVQVPFLFYDAADLVVLVETTVKTMGTDYTVSGAGNMAGGKVTFVKAPANNSRVTVIRKVEFKQLLSIPPNGIIPEGALSKALDRIVMMVQQLEERADRAVTYPEGTAKGDVANAQAILDSIEQGQKIINNAVAVAENTLGTANSKLQEIQTTSATSLNAMNSIAHGVEKTVNDVVHAAGLANPNLFINGGFGVWQRGTQIDNQVACFLADRFWCFTGNNQGKIGCQKIFIGIGGEYSGLGIKLIPKEGAAAFIEQKVSRAFKLSTRYGCSGVTFSFWSDTPPQSVCVANWSYSEEQYKFVLYDQPEVIEDRGIWKRYSCSFSFDYTPTGEADFTLFRLEYAANATAQTTGWKLEIGSVATAFVGRDNELALCQRYFFKIGKADIDTVIMRKFIPANVYEYFSIQTPSMNMGGGLTIRARYDINDTAARWDWKEAWMTPERESLLLLPHKLTANYNVDLQYVEITAEH